MYFEHQHCLNIYTPFSWYCIHPTHFLQFYFGNPDCSSLKPILKPLLHVFHLLNKPNCHMLEMYISLTINFIFTVDPGQILALKLICSLECLGMFSGNKGWGVNSQKRKWNFKVSIWNKNWVSLLLRNIGWTGFMDWVSLQDQQQQELK